MKISGVCNALIGLVLDGEPHHGGVVTEVFGRLGYRCIPECTFVHSNRRTELEHFDADGDSHEHVDAICLALVQEF